MSSVLVLAGVAATAFVSTNVDAFIVLVANVARAPGSRRRTTLGFLAATVLVTGAAWALAAASKIVPPSRAGLVGLVPVAMGVNQAVGLLRRWVRRRRRRAADQEASPESVPSSRGRDTISFREALGLHLSISLDNLAVYTALLADTLPQLRPLVVGTTFAMAAVWVALAHAALRVPGLSPVMLRWGHGVMAALLIGVGLYILADTDTDVLLPAAHAGAAETRH